MRLTYTAVTCLLLAMGCSEPKKEFDTIACGRVDASTNSNLHQVFKPCRKYIYQAKYTDQSGELISDEKIMSIPTGRAFGYHRDKQSEVVTQYLYEKSVKSKVENDPLNKTLTNTWVNKDSTGVLETKSKIWMQPFKANQYVFTQIAPFPEVILPVSTGMSWSSKRKIREGWGDWNGLEILNSYQVLSQDSLEFLSEKMATWHVTSKSKSEAGETQHDFWYNEKYGFVKMELVNHQGQKLQVELSEVTGP